MEAVTRARAFKRSWVDMAEALVEVRKHAWFERWGYETLQGYALEELNIKRGTVDKLTGSYVALEQHVPHVLQWDGVAQSMPDMDAVEYFARAVEPPVTADGERAHEPASADVVEQLKQAIFEDHLSSPSLRRRFNPLLSPKPEVDPQREQLGRLRASAQRLEGMLADVEGLSADTVEQVSAALAELRRELDALDAPPG
jgi:hypothetical protein